MIQWLQQNADIIGLAASLLLLVSLVLRGEERKTIGKLIAAVLFLGYGLLIWAKSLCFISIIFSIIYTYEIIQFYKKPVTGRIVTVFDFQNGEIRKIIKEERK